jgi:hypothetical protein
MHAKSPNCVDPEGLNFPRHAHGLALQKSAKQSSSRHLLRCFIEYPLTHGSKMSAETPQGVGPSFDDVARRWRAS